MMHSVSESPMKEEGVRQLTFTDLKRGFFLALLALVYTSVWMYGGIVGHYLAVLGSAATLIVSILNYSFYKVAKKAAVAGRGCTSGMP
jgi:hypothetical protein